jgi:hypothetical protein
MGQTIIDIIKALVIPEIPAIIKAIQATGETVTEAAIIAQLEQRGILQAAQVDAWMAAHPS